MSGLKKLKEWFDNPNNELTSKTMYDELMRLLKEEHALAVKMMCECPIQEEKIEELPEWIAQKFDMGNGVVRIDSQSEQLELLTNTVNQLIRKLK